MRYTMVLGMTGGLPHQCEHWCAMTVYLPGHSDVKNRVPGNRDAVKSGDMQALAQPLTEPAVTPLMMSLLRAMYTTTTGRMASRMNMYTLPMSNLE